MKRAALTFLILLASSVFAGPPPTGARDPIPPPCLPQAIDACGTGQCTALECWQVLVTYRTFANGGPLPGAPPEYVIAEATCGQAPGRSVAECRALEIMKNGLWIGPDPVYGDWLIVPPGNVEQVRVVNTR